MKAKIKVAYRKWWIPNKEYNINFPQSWGELNRDQFFKVMGVLLRKGNRQSAAVPELVMIFGKLKQVVAKNLTPTQYLEHFYDVVTWVFTQPIVIPYQTILHLRGNSFLMPSGKLMNLTIEEYIDAETHFLDFLDNQINESLNLLCATLCREFDHGQKVLKRKGLRVPYTKETTAIRAEILAELKEVEKYYILYFFIGCRNWIAREYFGYDPTTPNRQQSTSKHNWNDTLLRIAEAGIFGNYNEVMKTKAHDIFNYLKKNRGADKVEENDFLAQIRKNHQKHLN